MLIAVLMALVAVGYGSNLLFQKDKMNLWIPLVVMYCLSFIFFIATFFKQSVLSRHVLWASYVLIVIIGGRSLLFHYIYQGKLDDQVLCVPSQSESEC